MNQYQQGLEFQNVLVKPIPSNVNSRNNVDISVKLSNNLTLDFPLIASPMRGIVNADFALKLSELGGLAVLHRFYDTDEEWFNELEFLSAQPRCKFGAAIKLNDPNWEKVIDFNPNVLVVDLANGYIKILQEFCIKIKNRLLIENSGILLCAGNVCTKEGVQNLRDSGVDIVRVGLGNGSVCSTRNATSIGVPQITALQECSEVDDVIICSDGGLTGSGDAVKAIVAGADILMGGWLFSKVFESPNGGAIYGMASRQLMNEIGYLPKSIEGFSKTVDKNMSLKQFVEEFGWGIRSAATYLNARNLNEIQINGEFVLTGSGSIKNL
jgi:IMP dehydrogenase